MFKRHAQDMDWLEVYVETAKNKRSEGLGVALGAIFRLRTKFLALKLLSHFYYRIIFGDIFYIMGPDAFDVEHLPEYPSLWGLVTMMYYSIVTFTTLGFGDVVPKTLWASLAVMCEVILGYIMLGGLISIFANILARRS